MSGRGQSGDDSRESGACEALDTGYWIPDAGWRDFIGKGDDVIVNLLRVFRC